MKVVELPFGIFDTLRVTSFPIEEINGNALVLQSEQPTQLPGSRVGNIKHADILVVMDQFIR